MTTRPELKQTMVNGLGRMLRGAVLLTVGITALAGATLGLRPTTSPVVAHTTTALNQAPGIAFPIGMGVNGLPHGLTDYVLAMPVAAEQFNLAPGIAVPAGMGVNNLPRGFTDYIRDIPVTHAQLNQVPGISFPTGMGVNGLPRGFTDYVRAMPTVERSNVAPGISFPTGMGVNGLPRGFTDYILPNS